MQQIGLSELEVRMAFASLCVEATAKKVGVSYKEMFDRMKNVGLIQEYVKKLDPVHTQSREFVVDEILKTLKRLETSKKETGV
ncbi:MAG: DUF3791 domain-containing protein [Prevotella sp.]|nr:DUF3791 domain-containing protein [Prevotella sp.]